MSDKKIKVELSTFDALVILSLSKMVIRSSNSKKGDVSKIVDELQDQILPQLNANDFDEAEVMLQVKLALNTI